MRHKEAYVYFIQTVIVILIGCLGFFIWIYNSEVADFLKHPVGLEAIDRHWGVPIKTGTILSYWALAVFSTIFLSATVLYLRYEKGSEPFRFCTKVIIGLVGAVLFLFLFFSLLALLFIEGFCKQLAIKFTISSDPPIPPDKGANRKAS